MTRIKEIHENMKITKQKFKIYTGVNTEMNNYKKMK